MPNSFNSMCGKEPAQILIRWSLQRGCAYILTCLLYDIERWAQVRPPPQD
jgi:hypothetical protein